MRPAFLAVGWLWVHSTSLPSRICAALKTGFRALRCAVTLSRVGNWLASTRTLISCTQSSTIEPNFNQFGHMLPSPMIEPRSSAECYAEGKEGNRPSSGESDLHFVGNCGMIQPAGIFSSPHPAVVMRSQTILQMARLLIFA